MNQEKFLDNEIVRTPSARYFMEKPSGLNQP